MEEKQPLNYYILFNTHTQGMQLREYLKAESVLCKIAPAPRCIQGELGCGISLLIKEEDIERAKQVIEKHRAEHHSIVSLPCQINPSRFKFC